MREESRAGGIPCGRDPVGRDPVGRDPVGRDSVGRDPVGRDPVREESRAGGIPCGRDPVREESSGEGSRGEEFRGEGSRGEEFRGRNPVWEESRGHHVPRPRVRPSLEPGRFFPPGLSRECPSAKPVSRRPKPWVSDMVTTGYNHPTTTPPSATIPRTTDRWMRWWTSSSS